MLKNDYININGEKYNKCSQKVVWKLINIFINIYELLRTFSVNFSLKMGKNVENN